MSKHSGPLRRRALGRGAGLYWIVGLGILASVGANHRTPNFLVTASTAELARQVAEQAERCRSELALAWLGRELPNWDEPCPIWADVRPELLARGETSYMFFRGRPVGWQMRVQGSRTAVLRSVLPHEITHTLFASHFGRPIPRWAEEGACVTVEDPAEQQKLIEHLRIPAAAGQGVHLRILFAMDEYPSDVMPLYAQAYSLVDFLVTRGGRQKFVEYLRDGSVTHDWSLATRRHYGFDGLDGLQHAWLDWARTTPNRATFVVAGSTERAFMPVNAQAPPSP